VIIPSSNPTELLINEKLSDIQLDSLKSSLTYTDLKAQFALRKFKTNSHWFLRNNGQEALDEHMAALKAQTKVCLLQTHKDGSYATYSGLAGYLKDKLGTYVLNEVKYPEPQLLPWDKKPFDLYPYQQQIVNRLLEAKHARIEVGTGLGKSLALMYIVKQLGLKTVVMAPSNSISEQLYNDFVKHLGRKYVGQYFGGKKEAKKLIVVASAQSLTRVTEDSRDYELLASTQVFCADESHMTPAVTLQKVCFGVLKTAPYRFFFSATQMRGDGLGLLLDAITGPTVFAMTVKEGVDQGYLAKPIFHMFSAPMNGSYWSDDPNDMTRHHLLYNPHVVKMAADLCNNAVAAGMPVLILIDEVKQFAKLLPYLQYRADFAHGPLSENRSEVPKDFWESDPNELVREFNAGKLPILVGTSCIATGTDVQAVKFLVYLMGGRSEVQVKQAIGRGTRKVPGKAICHVVDFAVQDQQMMADGRKKWGPVGRHAKIRAELYEEIYGPVRFQ
jgi:hypothetical protein